MKLLLIYQKACCSMPDSVEASYRQQETGCRNGRLETVFQQGPSGKTYLAEQYSTYPFHICRVHYLDKALPDMASLYLQSCAGGIFSNDKLATKVQTKEGSRVHLTTQASTIVHRMEHGSADHVVDIHCDAHSLLEYIPDTTILFPQAKLRSKVTVTANRDSDVIIGEAFSSHDPDGLDEPFGWLETELIIQRPEGQIDVIDRYRITGDEFFTGELACSRDYSVYGTFMIISSRHNSSILASSLTDCISSAKNVYAGVSQLPSEAGYWVRYMAIDGISSKKLVTELWMVSRKWLTGVPPNVRRK